VTCFGTSVYTVTVLMRSDQAW